MEASPRLMARAAGVLYLIIIGSAFLIPFAVTPAGFLHGDAGLPSPAAILAAKPQYIASAIAQLIVGGCDIGVAVLLYKLMKPVGKAASLLMASLRIVFVAIANAALYFHFKALFVLTNPALAHSCNPEQIHALALHALRLRATGLDIALVFFGLHFLVLGYLILRSTFLPRIFGLLLLLAGLVYLANICVYVIPAETARLFFPKIMFAGAGEVLFALWLLVVGVNDTKWRAQAGAVSSGT
jgi:hypothetical protein